MEVNDFAMKHFERNMLDTPDGRAIGLAYFRERGINEAMVKRFHLGYSLDRRDDLLSAARKDGYSDDALVKTGLCVRTDRGDLYDRFKSRVMYPVFSISGKVVAFGGRTLRSDKTVAKYVNSPESVIYKKSRELYGLYQAKQAIVKKDKCILVEGYMDVISMHQQGVENVVASSGTSLTQGQIRLIHRFTENVTVIYDSDPAGIKASLRGIDLLLAEGLNIKVLLLPDGDDPDSFAQSHSASEVEAYLEANEVDFIRFKTDVLLRDAASDPLKRSEVVSGILLSIAHIPEEIKRNVYIQECSMRFGIDERLLLRQVNVFITKLAEQNARQIARDAAAESIGENSPEAGASSATDSNPSAGGENIGTETQTPPAPSVAESGSTVNAAPEIRMETSLQEAINLGSDPSSKILEPQERALMRLVLKYGMLDLGEEFGLYDDGAHVKVIDYIREDLEVDNMRFRNPLYSRMFEEALALREHNWDNDFATHASAALARMQQLEQEGLEEIKQTASTLAEINLAETKLKEECRMAYETDIRDFSQLYLEKIFISHPDDDVRRAASDLVVERHQLSKIYFRQGTRIETEIDRLDDLVPRALVALKYYMGRCKFHELTRRISQVQSVPGYDMAEIFSLMEQQKKWHDFCTQLATQIGERVYEPLR